MYLGWHRKYIWYIDVDLSAVKIFIYNNMDICRLCRKKKVKTRWCDILSVSRRSISDKPWEVKSDWSTGLECTWRTILEPHRKGGSCSDGKALKKQRHFPFTPVGFSSDQLEKSQLTHVHGGGRTTWPLASCCHGNLSASSSGPSGFQGDKAWQCVAECCHLLFTLSVHLWWKWSWTHHRSQRKERLVDLYLFAGSVEIKVHFCSPGALQVCVSFSLLQHFLWINLQSHWIWRFMTLVCFFS